MMIYNILLFCIVACRRTFVLCRKSTALARLHHDDAQVCNEAHGQPRKLVFGKFHKLQKIRHTPDNFLNRAEKKTFDFA